MKTFKVELVGGAVVQHEAQEAQVFHDGALVLFNHGELVVAYAAGRWQKIVLVTP